jgi:hypothetical protein
MIQLPSFATEQSPQPATLFCVRLFSDALIAFQMAQLPMPVTQFHALVVLAEAVFADLATPAPKIFQIYCAPQRPHCSKEHNHLT